MSLQFRSRIVGQNNPIGVLGNTATGWCCGYGGGYTRPQCVGLGGLFLPGETTSTNCPVKASTCVSGFVGDLEGACCSWRKVNNRYRQVCTLTTSKQNCIDLHQGAEEGLPYSFYAGQDCFSNGGNIICNGTATTQNDIDAGCNPDSSENCYNLQNQFGNCCTKLSDTSESECSITTQSDCAGFWVAPGITGILSCSALQPCSGVYYSTTTNGIKTPAKVSEIQVTNSENHIEKIPQIGSIYQGGLFVGIFRPGTPINSVGSTVYGSANINNIASDYIARGTQTGTGEKAWILIADTMDYGDYPYNLETEQPQTVTCSVYDGFYNTYQAESPNKNILIDTVQKFSKNGFSDWYIPSQDELAFYFKNINYGYSVRNYKPLTGQIYLSSTTYTVNGQQIFLGNKSFIICQTNTSSDYGKVLLIEKHKKASIRLFRRIYLY